MKLRKSKDISGQRFGRLVVVEQVDSTYKHNRSAMWLCKCDCGNEKKILGTTLRTGHGKSCGCYKRDVENGLLWTGHGEIGNWFWNAIKVSAKARHHEFTISIEEGWDLYLSQSRQCALTRIPIAFARQHRDRAKDQTASLDRIDSERGYISGNVQWLHKDVNYMKQDFDQSYFMKICSLITEHGGKTF